MHEVYVLILLQFVEIDENFCLSISKCFHAHQLSFYRKALQGGFDRHEHAQFLFLSPLAPTLDSRFHSWGQEFAPTVILLLSVPFQALSFSST